MTLFVLLKLVILFMDKTFHAYLIDKVLSAVDTRVPRRLQCQDEKSSHVELISRKSRRKNLAHFGSEHSRFGTDILLLFNACAILQYTLFCSCVLEKSIIVNILFFKYNIFILSHSHKIYSGCCSIVYDVYVA